MPDNQKPLTVVVIEDNVPDFLLIGEALNSEKIAHRLIHLRDGAEARSWITNLSEADLPPDLVVLDLNMPKVSGLEVLAALRSRDHLANVPVMVLTSSVAPAERDEARRLGAHWYLRKPVDLYDFLSQVGAVFRSLIVGE